MSKVSITRSLLDDLAMSISAKSGEAVPMTLTEMKDAVDSIQTGGGGTSWQTLYDGNVQVYSSSPNYFQISPYTTAFQSDQTYRVTLGQTQYLCNTIADPLGATYDGWLIGNLSIVGAGTDTGEPFIIYRNSATALTGGTTSSAGTHSLKIELQQGSGINLQTKTKTYTPTTSQQTESVSADSGYDGLSGVNVTVDPIPSQYIVPTGNKAITENGNNIDVSEYATVSVNVSGESKNTQVVQSTTRTSASTLTAIGAELTVSKTGTYDIYYSCFRTNTSASYTWATRLYINGTAYGTAENTTWTNNQQNTHLSNISLTADDKLRVYGRNTRGTSYYICAPMLVIVEA